MNDIELEAATPGASTREIWDDKIDGLHVRIYPSGRKVFYLRYRWNGKRLKAKLGQYRKSAPKYTLIMARTEADRKLADLKLGNNPFLIARDRAEQQDADALAKAARKTFAQLADDYLELYAKPNKKEKSWKDDKRVLTVDVIPYIGDVALEDIRRSACSEIIHNIMKRGAPSQADHCFKIMRAVFNWAVSEGIGELEHSPMSGMKAPVTLLPRERTLTEEEVRLVWDWIETSPSIFDLTRFALKFVLVTGQRPIDVCGLEKTDVTIHDGNPIWTIPGKRYKNHMAHLVPLSNMAMEILEDIERVKQDLDYLNVKTYDYRDGVCHHCGKVLPGRSSILVKDNSTGEFLRAENSNSSSIIRPPHPGTKFCSSQCRSDRAVLLRKAKREPRYINSPYVFQSDKKLNKPINPEALPRAVRRGRDGALADMEDWTPHDLRRTCGTNITGLVKETQEIMDKVLGHKDRSIGATYNRYAYLTEKRRALDGWARELHRILSGSSQVEEGNVISLYR
jgi:integrase